jgi:hypothetical protein
MIAPRRNALSIRENACINSMVSRVVAKHLRGSAGGGFFTNTFRRSITFEFDTKHLRASSPKNYDRDLTPRANAQRSNGYRGLNSITRTDLRSQASRARIENRKGRAWKLRWRGQLSEAWKSQCNCHPGASNAGGHRSWALVAISHAGVYSPRYARAAELRCRINMRIPFRSCPATPQAAVMECRNRADAHRLARDAEQEFCLTPRPPAVRTRWRTAAPPFP